MNIKQILQNPGEMQRFKKDNFILGFILGITIPLILFGLILMTNFITIQIGLNQFYLDLKINVLISLAGNLVLIRYYFVTLKYDKTGRGVLLITFIMMILFFVLKDRLL